MNYRHAFHAGNFADVVKHVVLTRIFLYLHGKPAPFRVIDTHAGAGLYDLAGEEARRGGEWQGGIGRLFAAMTDAAATPTPAAPSAIPPKPASSTSAMLPPDAAALLAPYCDIVRAYNADGVLTAYPGSPLIARALLRPQDRLVACELEPDAHANLLDALRRDPQGRVVALDGWTALTAFVPPKERRGVVLIDPPFEQRDEFEHLATGFAAAYRKWPTGIYVLWYPVKDRSAANRLWAAVRDVAAKGLGVEIAVAPSGVRAGLDCAGVIVVNPPWVLADELARLMPPLAACLGDAGTGRFRLESFDGVAASRG